MNFNPEEYTIFEYITGENLDTLLTCAGAAVKECAPQEELLDEEMKTKKCALILEGSAVATGTDGREITLDKGVVFGKSFFEKDRQPYFSGIKAGENCRLLVMNHDGMTVPCWFSCFFHACFIDNLEKAGKRQMELLG